MIISKLIMLIKEITYSIKGGRTLWSNVPLNNQNKFLKEPQNWYLFPFKGTAVCFLDTKHNTLIQRHTYRERLTSPALVLCAKEKFSLSLCLSSKFQYTNKVVLSVSLLFFKSWQRQSNALDLSLTLSLRTALIHNTLTENQRNHV